MRKVKPITDFLLSDPNEQETTCLTTHFGTPPIRLIPRCEAPEYLRFIRTLPCIVKGCNGPATAHHCIFKARSNWASDFGVVPLCPEHHNLGPLSVHRLGPSKFELEHNLSLGLSIIRCVELWHEAGYTL